MSGKDLDRRLVENIHRGLARLSSEGEDGESIEGSTILEHAIGFPFSDHARLLANGSDPAVYEPRTTPAVWRALMEATAAIEISRIATEYGSLCAFRCQSPVEELFLLSLTIVARARHWHIGTPWPYGQSQPGRCCAHGNRRLPPTSLMICPQHSVGQVHVDFMVTLADATPEKRSDGSWEPVWREEHILVECDGHDFHEKTKDQARRDKKRDRELQKVGFQVFRYTGSEIWTDPVGVANEIVNMLWGRLYPPDRDGAE